jgi:hypothetical protein
MATEWTPRTVPRTKSEAAETSADDPAIAYRNGRPTPLMQALLDALAPFADARRAVADALRRFAFAEPGCSP